MTSEAERDPLNGLDARISTKGYFERILHEQEKRDAERLKRIDERFEASEKALDLQAREYERRLHDLNGEYARDRLRQSNYVTVDKYEDKLLAESNARRLALERVDEKFDDYVKRYEQDKRDLDITLAVQKTATDGTQRAAEDNARLAKDAAAEQGRRANRNLVVVGLLLTAIIALANFIAPLLGALTT